MSLNIKANGYNWQSILVPQKLTHKIYYLKSQINFFELTFGGLSGIAHYKPFALYLTTIDIVISIPNRCMPIILQLDYNSCSYSMKLEMQIVNFLKILFIKAFFIWPAKFINMNRMLSNSHKIQKIISILHPC